MDWSIRPSPATSTCSRPRCLQAVRIVAGTSDSRFLPEITASAKQVQDAAAVDTYFHAGIEAIWDLGLFGAAESAQLSAQASAGNAEALRGAAQVAVIADVVRSYLDLTVAQAQQDLLARQQAVDDRGEQLALVRQRLRLDEPGELDRLRARQAATRAATAQARENADNAARALALLLGRDGPDPACVPIARRRRWCVLAAAGPGLSAAPSAADPAGRIGGDAGCCQQGFGTRRDVSACQPRWLHPVRLQPNPERPPNSDSSPSIGPYIDIPLWDWGQRRARFHADEKQLDAALLGYRKAVLEGVSEVEGALGSLARQDSSIQRCARPMMPPGNRSSGRRGRCSWGCPANSTGLTGSVRHSPRRPT